MNLWGTLAIMLVLIGIYTLISIGVGVSGMLLFAGGQLLGMVTMALFCAAGNEQS